MNKQFRIFFLILWVFHTHSYVTITSLREIIDYIPDQQNVVCVLDIDNTFLEPDNDHGMGSDQHFYHRINHHAFGSNDYQYAIAQAVKEYNHMHMHIELKPIENDICDIMKKIKSVSKHVICLTARAVEIAQHTVSQCNKHDLQFHIADVHDHIFSAPHTSAYFKGILFCEKNDKGSVLLHFINQLPYVPSIIIFVDDKEKNLLIVEKALQAKNIPCILFKYDGCKEKVETFDPAPADAAFEIFLTKHPLS